MRYYRWLQRFFSLIWVFMPVISCAALSPQHTISVTAGVSRLAINPTTNRLYAANTKDTTVLAIDGKTNTVITTIQANEIFFTGGAITPLLVVNTSTNTIYVTSLSRHQIIVIDGSANTVTGYIQTDSSLSGMDVDSITNTLYVTSRNVLIAIDCKTNTIRTTTAIFDDASENYLGDAIVNPGTYMVYIQAAGPLGWTLPNNNTGGNDFVVAIDGKTDAVIAEFSVARGPNYWAGVNSDTNRIYLMKGRFGKVIGEIDGKVNTYDPSSIVPVIPPGNNISTRMGINPTTNTFYLVIDDQVVPVDGAAHVGKGDRVPVGHGLHDIAVNPTTNTIYVSNSDDGTISVIP